jgi:hypothetical protein
MPVCATPILPGVLGSEEDGDEDVALAVWVVEVVADVFVDLEMRPLMGVVTFQQVGIGKIRTRDGTGRMGEKGRKRLELNDRRGETLSELVLLKKQIWNNPFKLLHLT